MATRLVGRADEGIAVDGIAEIGDRLLMIAFALIDQAASMEGLRVFRIEADRLVEIGACLDELALLAQQIGAAEIGRRMVRIDRDRLIEIRQRRVVLIYLPIGERAIGQRGGIIGVELDGGREVGNRFLEAADAGIGDAARIIGFSRRIF